MCTILLKARYFPFSVHFFFFSATVKKRSFFLFFSNLNTLLILHFLSRITCFLIYSEFSVQLICLSISFRPLCVCVSSFFFHVLLFLLHHDLEALAAGELFCYCCCFVLCRSYTLRVTCVRTLFLFLSRDFLSRTQNYYASFFLCCLLTLSGQRRFLHLLLLFFACLRIRRRGKKKKRGSV